MKRWLLCLVVVLASCNTLKPVHFEALDQSVETIEVALTTAEKAIDAGDTKTAKEAITVAKKEVVAVKAEIIEIKKDVATREQVYYQTEKKLVSVSGQRNTLAVIVLLIVVAAFLAIFTKPFLFSR